MYARERRMGFTLIELLVVIGIIGLLTGLLLSAVQRVREAGNRARCLNHLHQTGVALHQYHDAQASLPPGIRGASDPYPFLSWRVRITPFLDQIAVWEQARRDFQQIPYFGGEIRHAGESVLLPIFTCPSEPRRLLTVPPEGNLIAFSHYLGVSGENLLTDDGVIYFESRVRLPEITDGTSSTLMVGERPPSPDLRFGWWYAGVGQFDEGSADAHLGVREMRVTYRAPTCPVRRNNWFRSGDVKDMCDTFHFWSHHPGGAHFLFADGSVRFLSYSAEPLMVSLATRAGSEAASPPD